MEKRDYIETMIEQMGLFLKRLLSDLIKNNGTENIDQTINSIEELFEKEFKISIQNIILQSENDFENFLLKNKFNSNHLESLSEILFQMSLSKKNTEKNFILLKEKAVFLLDLVDSISNSYSIERNFKKNNILNTKY